MKLCVERRDAATGTTSIVSCVGPGVGGEPIDAVVLDGNPLADDWQLPDGALPRRVVLWSGTLGEDPFEPHPANWLAAGRETLDATCARLAPRFAAAGSVVCLRPHCRHVLSDAPSTTRFLADHEEGPFSLALDPARLFEPSMVHAAADHLDRILSQLGPRCELLYLSDLDGEIDGPLDGGADADTCRVVPLGRGVLPRDVLVDLIALHVPANTPIVLLPEDVDAQRRWLGV